MNKSNEMVWPRTKWFENALFLKAHSFNVYLVTEKILTHFIFFSIDLHAQTDGRTDPCEYVLRLVRASCEPHPSLPVSLIPSLPLSTRSWFFAIFCTTRSFLLNSCSSNFKVNMIETNSEKMCTLRL